MSSRLMARPDLLSGLLKASATFQEPDVRLSCWNGEMPTLVIEEGGVVMELEFPDQGSLARFQRRIAGLLVLDTPRGRGG